jgi:hypothetical protein
MNRWAEYEARTMKTSNHTKIVGGKIILYSYGRNGGQQEKTE